MATIREKIRRLGASDARDARRAGCDITTCGDIDETAISSIRDILRRSGDERAELLSLGYRSEGRDLMEAYASGWDSVAERPGRPRRDPAAARIKISERVHPDTLTRISAEATRSGESRGQVIDRLAQTLKK